jgi:uncharacterized protein YegP (UPF0339 family)
MRRLGSAAFDAVLSPIQINLHAAEERTPDMAHTFEIYKDKAGEFRVRFKYNSEVMFASEGYSSKASAQNAIDSVKANGPGAEVVDNS